jgi:ribosomal protein S18 acetylase RimI-like enzyme
MTVPRLKMSRSTEAFDMIALANMRNLDFRLMRETDGRLLGELMYASYLDTVDYEGETLDQTIAEAEATLSGKYGAMLFNASYIGFAKDEPDTARGAAVITDFDKTGPLLAFSLTAPGFQRRGIAGLLIRLALGSLHKMDMPTLSLVVTSTNEPAVTLYRKLGFKNSEA